jgi:hypothetical protein
MIDTTCHHHIGQTLKPNKAPCCTNGREGKEAVETSAEGRDAMALPQKKILKGWWIGWKVLEPSLTLNATPAILLFG